MFHTHFENITKYQDNGLKGSSFFKRHEVQIFFFSPVFVL